MKTYVSSNLTQVKSTNRCTGCPNFNFSASGENHLRSKDLSQVFLPSLTKGRNYPRIYFVE